jgi:hypothetical protein
MHTVTGMPHKSTSNASERRKVKVAANVRHFYARAEYVTPRVALDATHAKALRAFMRAAGLGVSDAIRAAIVNAAPEPKRRVSAAKSRSATTAPHSAPTKRR